MLVSKNITEKEEEELSFFLFIIHDSLRATCNYIDKVPACYRRGCRAGINMFVSDGR